MDVTKQSGRKTKKVGSASRLKPAANVVHLTDTKGLVGLFSGRAVAALLKLFFLHPTRDFYQRELSHLIDERLFLVQKALTKLVQSGLISRVSSGNRVYYRANQGHPAFGDLKAVILKTIGLGDVLRAELTRLKDKIKIAFLYGSVARGEETGTSDIDIMLIGNLSGREVASILSPIKKELNREINPSVYSEEEFRTKARERHTFITTVLHEPKLFLLGDGRALEAVLSRRTA
ncbi:MAG TPA: nucleotidyltransferase domain-containing protein [Methylomirabilota bacterium]|nr:nucleotidyltransferase domain-containing protein [Methylomirabilota bacterium]